jgi:hypothetical protein
MGNYGFPIRKYGDTSLYLLYALPLKVALSSGTPELAFPGVIIPKLELRVNDCNCVLCQLKFGKFWKSGIQVWKFGN